MVRDYLNFDADDETLNAFLDEFQRESDRAAAVLGAAYLDDLLKTLLEASVTAQNRITRDLFQPMGPLGTFSSRINIAYAFGFITLHEAEDLNRIRDLRNKFAHRIHGLSFAERSIADRCQHFRCNQQQFETLPDVRDEYPRDARALFNLATALLAFYVRRRIRTAERVESSPPPHTRPTPAERLWEDRER